MCYGTTVSTKFALVCGHVALCPLATRCAQFFAGVCVPEEGVGALLGEGACRRPVAARARLDLDVLCALLRAGAFLGRKLAECVRRGAHDIGIRVVEQRRDGCGVRHERVFFELAERVERRVADVGIGVVERVCDGARVVFDGRRVEFDDILHRANEDGRWRGGVGEYVGEDGFVDGRRRSDEVREGEEGLAHDIGARFGEHVDDGACEDDGEVVDLAESHERGEADVDAGVGEPLEDGVRVRDERGPVERVEHLHGAESNVGGRVVEHECDVCCVLCAFGEVELVDGIEVVAARIVGHVLEVVVPVRFGVSNVAGGFPCEYRVARYM